MEPKCYTTDQFIRWFHQSRIPNLRIFIMNFCYQFFFIWQTEKKELFWADKKFVFFFIGSNWEKFVEKLVEQIGENIWWIRCISYISNNGNNCILSKTGVWINYENEIIISVKNLIVFMYILVAKHKSIRWLSLKKIWIRTDISVDS